MAATPAPKNTVHWGPSPLPSPLSDSCSSASTSSTSSASTLQYINAQLISHGFAVSPGLCLDGISSPDAEGVTKCLLSMLGQRVEDMTRAEELTTKLRTLSYDYERLHTMHGAATETAESAEREAAAARAKLTIAKRAQTQAEAMHKQTTGDLQRARTALQALRATHVAEIKRREKEIEAMRERWSKLSDAQLKIGMLPSGMTASSPSLQPANAAAVTGSDGTSAAGDGAQRGRGIADVALEEAEKACAGLREENGELKALAVDAANAVRKILHKTLSSDPDDLESPPPLATIDLFPLGAPDAAFEKFSALLTSLRNALATLRTCDALPAAGTASTSGSNPKPQISLADLAKKAADSDAKAHKWEVEELRATIASLRDELRKVKGERKSAPASRLQDVLVAQDNLASYLPPNDGLEVGPALEPQHDQVTNSEPDVCSFSNQKRVEQSPPRKRDLLVSTKPEVQRTAAPPAAAPQPGPSRLSPRKTRSKSKVKPVFKSPLKATRRASASAKRTASGSRPKRPTSGLTGKRVEASFETEVKPSTVPAASLLPTSFVLPPPSPESRPPPHLDTLFTPPVPLQLIPSSTTPLFSPSAQPPPPASSSTPITAPPERGETRAVASEDIIPSVAQPSIPQPPTSKPFPAAKPQMRNMSHAYSPAKPSPLSRILMLADSPETVPTAAAAPIFVAPPPASQFNSGPLYHPGAFTSSAVPVFEQPPIPAPIVVPTLPPVPVLAPAPTINTNSAPAPAPVPLRTGSTSNAAGAGATSQRRRKRTSREAELDLDADTGASKAKSKSNANANDARPNSKSADAEAGLGMDVDSDAAPTRDPRAPEKENTIRRRLKGGPAAVAKTRGSSGGGVKTRKMAATAAKSGAPKSSAPAPAPVVMNEPPPAAEGARVGGAAGRLLAAVRGGGGIGPGRLQIDSTEASLPARRVS